MSWMERSIYLFAIAMLGVALYSMQTSNAALGEQVPNAGTAAAEVRP